MQKINHIKLDTLQLSQSEFENKIKSLPSLKLNNEDNIRSIVETFLIISKAKARRGELYDEKFLIKNDKLIDGNILYRLKKNKYQYELNKAVKRNIVWDDLQFNNFIVQIKESEAIANIVEDYKYYIDDSFKELCNKTTEYTFTLSLSDGKWYITNIKTNDPWEENPEFVYRDFDTTQILNEVLCQDSVNETPPQKIEPNSVATISSLYKWLYNTAGAVRYAAKWYNGVNPLFGQATQDCQNFAS